MKKTARDQNGLVSILTFLDLQDQGKRINEKMQFNQDQAQALWSHQIAGKSYFHKILVILILCCLITFVMSKIFRWVF